MSTPTIHDQLQHADWCTAGRTEQTEHADAGITTTHCIDCGSHVALTIEGRKLAPPL